MAKVSQPVSQTEVRKGCQRFDCAALRVVGCRLWVCVAVNLFARAMRVSGLHDGCCDEGNGGGLGDRVTSFSWSALHFHFLSF